MRLRWDAPDASLPDFRYAYSGKVCVGLVYRRTGQTLWHYKIDGVQTRWITKGYGEVSSEAVARRALIRAWKTWIEHAGLTPAAEVFSR
jgi:LPS sulfotransferase NodH